MRPTASCAARRPAGALTSGGIIFARANRHAADGGGSTRVYAFAMVLVAVAVAARCFPRTLDAAMVVATEIALLAARGWAETNFPRTMQAIAERLGGASYEGVARESEARGAGRGREDSV